MRDDGGEPNLVSMPHYLPLIPRVVVQEAGSNLRQAGRPARAGR